MKQLLALQARYYWEVRERTIAECFNPSVIAAAGIVDGDAPNVVVEKLRLVATRTLGAHTNKPTTEQTPE